MARDIDGFTGHAGIRATRGDKKVSSAAWEYSQMALVLPRLPKFLFGLFIQEYQE